MCDYDAITLADHARNIPVGATEWLLTPEDKVEKFTIEDVFEDDVVVIKTDTYGTVTIPRAVLVQRVKLA